MPDFHVAFRGLLHAVNLRHGTDGFTSPPKEGVLRIFSTASDGFEPANLGTKGQHATSRPPKPLKSRALYIYITPLYFHGSLQFELYLWTFLLNTTHYITLDMATLWWITTNSAPNFALFMIYTCF